MKRILIATDGSAGARAAVVNGIELARSSGAAVAIVSVWPSPREIIGEPYYQRALTTETQKARRAVDEAVARADKAGVASEAEIVEGNPAERIVELARLRDVDLIVVGARPLTRLAKALVGSVSSAVVQHADRPVLVVNERPKPAQRAA